MSERPRIDDMMARLAELNKSADEKRTDVVEEFLKGHTETERS